MVVAVYCMTMKPMMEYFIHLQQQYSSNEIKLVFSSADEIPPWGDSPWCAYLLARRLVPILAGLAADGHTVRPDVHRWACYDGQKP